jgi:hypothetical protein
MASVPNWKSSAVGWVPCRRLMVKTSPPRRSVCYQPNRSGEYSFGELIEMNVALWSSYNDKWPVSVIWLDEAVILSLDWDCESPFPFKTWSSESTSIDTYKAQVLLYPHKLNELNGRIIGTPVASGIVSASSMCLLANENELVLPWRAEFIAHS